MNEAAKLQALATYFDLMAMNGGARIYHVARQLGVFEAVRAGAASSETVAAECGLQERPTGILLDALCELRVLQCVEGAYSLTPVMLFLSGSYQDLSDAYWDHLPRLLKTGVPLAKMDSAAQSEQQYEKQVSALAWMMKPAAAAASVMLRIGEVRKDLQILDVGAGSAIWSLTFAAKDPGAAVTAVDWPAILKIAADAAQALGLQDRFTAIPGNYHEVELPDAAYDLAIVGNVTHIETPEGNRALLAKLHAALKASGEIVIFDVMGGQRQGGLSKSLYALGLALRTERGQVYTREQLQGFLTDSGFAQPSFSPVEVPPYTMGMMLAGKE